MANVPDHAHDLRYYRRSEIDYRLQPDQLLAKLLTVDGSGSGLDADTLDGSHASAFAASSHTHDDRYFTETEADARYGRLAAANTWTQNQYFSPTLVAGTYSVQVTGAAGAARDIFLAGQSGYSNGFTVQYTGTEMRYSFLSGKMGVGGAPATSRLHVYGSVAVDGDNGGIAGATTFTDVTAGVSTGSGTVKMNGATARNSVGWLKIYVGTTAAYIPYWTTITG